MCFVSCASWHQTLILVSAKLIAIWHSMLLVLFYYIISAGIWVLRFKESGYYKILTTIPIFLRVKRKFFISFNRFYIFHVNCDINWKMKMCTFKGWPLSSTNNRLLSCHIQKQKLSHLLLILKSSWWLTNADIFNIWSMPKFKTY